MAGSFHVASTILATFPFCFAFSSAGIANDRERKNTATTCREKRVGCVKTITCRFENEKHVARVECNIEKKSVTPTPNDRVRLAARAVREIMGGFPRTLARPGSPEGTFTSRTK